MGQNQSQKGAIIRHNFPGNFRITECGYEALKMNPTKITREFLEQYPEYQKFNNGLRAESKNEENETREEDLLQTPEERLGTIYQEIRHNLAQELLENIKKCSHKFFENLVTKKE